MTSWTCHPARPSSKRGGGSHAGHNNGLRDIHAQLGGSDYWRLRIGIGHPGVKGEVIHWVLKSPCARSTPADRGQHRPFAQGLPHHAGRRHGQGHAAGAHHQAAAPQATLALRRTRRRRLTMFFIATSA